MHSSFLMRLRWVVSASPVLNVSRDMLTDCFLVADREVGLLGGLASSAVGFECSWGGSPSSSGAVSLAADLSAMKMSNNSIRGMFNAHVCMRLEHAGTAVEVPHARLKLVADGVEW